MFENFAKRIGHHRLKIVCDKKCVKMVYDCVACIDHRAIISRVESCEYNFWCGEYRVHTSFLPFHKVIKILARLIYILLKSDYKLRQVNKWEDVILVFEIIKDES